jgi:hypothetical protein
MTLNDVVEKRGIFDTLEFLFGVLQDSGEADLARIVLSGEARESQWLRERLIDVITNAEYGGMDWIKRSGTDHLEAMIYGLPFDGRIVTVEFARKVLTTIEKKLEK